ncbi:MAG: hypothetical protein MK066_05730 [Crocinitomicaceae bacterium]|nr:hypothetical protein [Crocinitomicaceae bacterium]
MKKEDWISDKLSVSNSITRTIPSDDFLDRLKAIPENMPNIEKVRKPVIWAAAASITILLALNIFSYLQDQNDPDTTLGETYFLHTQKL